MSLAKSLFVRVRAPFAAFRWLQSGVYRSTSPVIPPSTAWGLLLGLAGIETRGSLAEATTPIRPDAPRLELAVASVSEASTCVLYQQLHSYPVGPSGKDLKAKTHGAKYWIAPARRELLVGFDCAIGVRGNQDVIDRIGPGLSGAFNDERYGLPFAGDNNLLIDRIDILDETPTLRWYTPVDESERPRAGSCRLTVAIDRSDSSRTKTTLFAPMERPGVPPESAWVNVGPIAQS
ncbi:MAG TPA: CRISPR-associated protein Cas5 [Fimbriimonadales bacterium]|nr:CRISPR-associated protein Cas5 [Fimbriimonadales bacterium]